MHQYKNIMLTSNAGWTRADDRHVSPDGDSTKIYEMPVYDEIMEKYEAEGWEMFQITPLGQSWIALTFRRALR
ncbi:MAG: hypothetical protein LBM23_04115 [Propionibacteriaceae bacterium]|jgi:hypothetical protein|nr:hypothetical protein [Propionibacteriaceae bacterium]